MEFFASVVDTLKVLATAIGAWDIVNLLESYGANTPASNAHVW